MSDQHVSDLLVTARAELRERWTDYRDDFGPLQNEPHDVIHEIADGCVPLYTSQLLRLAVEDIELATATLCPSDHDVFQAICQYLGRSRPIYPPNRGPFCGVPGRRCGLKRPFQAIPG